MKRQLLFLLVLITAIAVNAQTPNIISFQGNLTTPGTNNPIANGTYSMGFILYDDLSNELWTETQETVQVTNGLINVQLGSVTPLEINDFYQPLYLEITIEGETLSPQIPLQTVPFAQTSKAVVGTDSIIFRVADQKAGIVDQTNTALGFYSFTSEEGSGFFNEAIGVGALENNNGGSQNVAIGSYALGSNISGATNIAIGYEALLANTTSSNNVAIGPLALQANTDGNENIGVGSNALSNNTTGFQNLGIGFGSLTTNTIGSGNVALGVDALNQNGDGNENTAIGSFALENSIGTGNTVIGGNALRPLASGSFNVSVGYNTGSSAVGVDQTNGSYNTFIGTDASGGIDGLTNATAIGAGAVVSQDNSLVLGDGNVNVGIGTSTPGKKLSVVGDIQASDSIKADVFAYNTPKIGFASIHNSAFSIAYNPNNIYYSSGNSNGFYRRIYGGTTGDPVIITGSISLPHGAIITGLRMRIFEQEASYSTFAQLYRHGVNDQTENLIATTNTSTDVGGQIISTATINPSLEKVDNQNWSYYIKLTVNSGVIMYFYSASVSYILETN